MHPLRAAALAVRASAAWPRLLDAVARDRRGVAVAGAPGVAGPLVVALLGAETGRPVWLTSADIRAARRLVRDLEAIARAGVVPVEAHVLPPLEGDPYALVGPHDNIQRERVATFEAIAAVAPPGVVRVVVAPAATHLLKSPAPGRAAVAALELEVGAELPPHDAAAALLEAGYVATDVVSTWGEFSRRGAVLDVFPPDSELPIRAEYWGDEITELRRFDPETQRSVGAVTAVRIGAVREAAPDLAVARAFAARVRERVHEHGLAPPLVERLLDALDEHGAFPGFEILRWAVADGVAPEAHLPGAIRAIERPDLVEAELRRARDTMRDEWSEELRAFLPGPDEVLRTEAEALETCAAAHVALVDVAWADAAETADLAARSVPRHGGDLTAYLRLLRPHLESGGAAALVLASPGRLERMREVLRESGLGERIAWSETAEQRAPEQDEVPPGHVTLGLGVVEEGARIGSLLLSTESDVFGDVPAAPRERKRKRVTPFTATDLRDLKRGDNVVHVDHGIGRFDGLVTMGAGEGARDFMVLLYLNDDKLYVPLDRLDLVERYSGVAGFAPRLDRLGGTTWEKVKRTVKKAMLDMTRELLDLYAARMTATGFRFSQDGEWQREFEDAFPHEPTDDQVRAIEEVKADMTSGRPMDRLVVGDVGYGKTEVAFRAVFKAVMDGKQAAFLAPTTVLSLQHHSTMTRRFSAWPVRVELLSRFRSDAQIQETLEKLAAGEVDVVVGTHRLLSKDVLFKDLGLLVVDEEQRFGVRHKERMKMLRKEVAVLTLTATPIPRTLSMALGGLRDMSVIETPPVGRHAIATFVLPFSQEVIAGACRQELDRGGQVYLVHDRVQSIYSMADLVRRLVPGARVGVAHGQMPEKALEEAMIRFLRGETDILVCTTVIENGLDIARANTILINRADRHGLSQLYQLRGRVGRSDRQAHAYLFVPGKSELTAEARKRLAALQEFTELGSGFRIAALDLEIRGSGNLLGGEQHGHIAAVGFDMYVRLLEDTVRELKGQPSESGFRAAVTLPLDLRLPEAYVAEENQRLTIYKRFATVRAQDDIEPLVQEVRDRFGAPPPALERLAEHARIRVRAERLRITAVEADSRSVRLTFSKETKVHPTALMRILQERAGSSFSPDGTLTVPTGEMLPPDAAWDVLREIG
jgi:transcription-repair coupling factor (superfamily II helicase)